MLITEIDKGTDVLLQANVNNKLFTLNGTVIDSVDNNVRISLNEDEDYAYKALDKIEHLDVSYITNAKQFVVFRDVTFVASTQGNTIMLIVSSNMPGEFLDRRAYPRFEVNIKGMFSVANGQVYNECVINDVSQYGLKLSTKLVLKVGDVCNITFFDKLNKEQLNFSANVVRRDLCPGNNSYGINLSSNKLIPMCKKLQKIYFQECVPDIT